MRDTLVARWVTSTLIAHIQFFILRGQLCNQTKERTFHFEVVLVDDLHGNGRPDFIVWTLWGTLIEEVFGYQTIEEFSLLGVIFNFILALLSRLIQLFHLL